jgi:hypothetical protein
LVAAWHNLVVVASHNDNIIIFTNGFVVMAVAEKPISVQVLRRFIAIMRDCDWCNQFYCGLFGAFTIIKGCGPVALCGKGLVVALHGIGDQLPCVARGSLLYPA